MEKKLTLSELINELTQSNSLPKKLNEELLKNFVEIIQTNLLNGESVKIAGIGMFKTVDVEPRKSVNVNTGKEIEIPGYKKAVLVPEKSLAMAINAPFAEFVTIELDDEPLQEADKQASPIVDSITPEIPKEKPGDEISLEKNQEVLAEGFTSEKSQEEIIPESDPKEEKISEGIPTPPALQQEESEASSSIQIPTPEMLPEESPISEKEPSVVPPNIPEVKNQESDSTDTSIEEESSSFLDEYDEEEQKKTRHRIFFKGFFWGTLTGILLMCILTLVVGLWSFNSISPTENQPKELTSDTIGAVSETPETDNPTLTEQKSLEPIATETVAQNYFLTTMARKYYGDFHFWVYIYEENKAKLGHPDKVAPGTKVVIPAPEKYGIDKNDPHSLAQAEEKSKEIYARFK